MSLGFATSLDPAIPELSPLPSCTSHRLIDSGTLHYEASASGFAERYRRGETPHTVHVWWARRPYSAMRSLVFACLSKDTSPDAHTIMNNLSGASTASSLVLSAARSRLNKDYSASPRVLDMFGGGGTIAFEGTSLGADMYSIDSNELSVFIQKSILVYPQNLSSTQLLHHVEQSGKNILEKLTTLTADLFPHRDKTFAYFWSYSTKCAACGYQFYLAKRPWLSRKNGKRIGFKFSDGEHSQQVSVSEGVGESEHSSAWLGRNGTVSCPRCKHTAKGIKIQDCHDAIVGAARISNTGKCFVGADSGAIPPFEKLAAREQKLLSMLGMTLPDSLVPRWSGIVNPSLYGITTHADFLNPRQRIVLLSLILCLREEFDLLASSVSPEIARGAIGLLSGLIDQLVDWNCRLSMWIPQNEQVGRAFCGPGIAMLWDYAETDPVSAGPSNLWSKLDRIIVGTRAVSTPRTACTVMQSCAQELPFGDEFFDAIVTDPPYYDNIFYNALADFFFAWKQPILTWIDPDLSKNLQTDSTRELVASTFRSGNPRKAHEDYCREFGQAIKEAERTLKFDGVFALLYSHGSLGGWEALVRAYRSTRLTITSVQPLSIERKQRPRAMTSEAVNTCVIFVSHKSTVEKSTEEIGNLCARLEGMVEPLRKNLLSAGWHERDIALAAYSQGVGMLANVSSVSGVRDDIEALKQFEGIIKEKFPTFRVTARKSL